MSDSFVDKVERVGSPQTFTNIKYPKGKQSTASLWDLAPYPDSLDLPLPSANFTNLTAEHKE